MNNTIGWKIRKAREKRGYSQDELSKRANLPYTTVSKLEVDILDNPTIDTLTKIAKGLGISVLDLIPNKGQEKDDK